MSNNVKVFISVPMNERSDEEIEGAILLTKRAFLKKMEELGQRSGNTFIITDNYHVKHAEPKKDCIDERLYYLSEAIGQLSTCQIAVFGKGWKEARGCRMEHEICENYRISIVEPKSEEDSSNKIYY